jgi:hypothetical protein
MQDAAARWYAVSGNGSTSATTRNGFYAKSFTFLDSINTEPGGYDSTLIAHELGHAIGLGHTETTDQLFSTGIAPGDNVAFAPLYLNPYATNYLTIPDATRLLLEDGSKMPSFPFNLMSYQNAPCMFTKEQRLVSRYFTATCLKQFVSDIVPRDVNTSYLNVFPSSNTSSNVTTDYVETGKVRTSSVVSDRLNSHIVESDSMIVNGMVKSQISKTEMGIFDTIVLGNGQKTIYLDDSGRLVLGDIVIFNDNGVIKFLPATPM